MKLEIEKTVELKKKAYSLDGFTIDEKKALARSLGKRYRDACLRYAHLLNINHMYIAKKNRLTEDLENRHADTAVQLDFVLRCLPPSSFEEYSKNIKDVIGQAHLKCRKTSPRRAILEEQHNKIRKELKEALCERRSLHRELMLLLYDHILK